MKGFEPVRVWIWEGLGETWQLWDGNMGGCIVARRLAIGMCVHQVSHSAAITYIEAKKQNYWLVLGDGSFGTDGTPGGWTTGV